MPTIWITIHRIQNVDPIEGPTDGEPDWLYTIEVWDGDGWVSYSMEEIVGNGILTENHTHVFTLENLNANSTSFFITLFEKDTFISLLEVADISGKSGTVRGDQREPAPLAAKYNGQYHLGTDFLSGDPASYSDGYYKTSGDFDGSTSADENDADLWFAIIDNYDYPVAEAGQALSVMTREEVHFDGGGSTASDGSSLVLYEWDFDGDGSFDATGPSVSHSYGQLGVYQVTLRVTDSIGSVSVDTTMVSVLNRDPIALFNYTPLEPTFLQTISFVDMSTDLDGEIVSWLWDFGDSAVSTLQNSTHRYEDKGLYDVRLIVTDNDGGSGEYSVSVSVVNLPPKANFEPSEDSANVGDEVRFLDKSSDPEGKTLTYLWDFGDGTTSSEKSPTHVYVASGTREVTLTVTDDEGLSDRVAKVFIVFPKIRPEADFTFTPEEAVMDDKIQFHDGSEDEDGYITSWSWEFGDGKSSSRKDPDHVYSDKGNFYVTLTVADNDGNVDSLTKRVLIGNLPPVADFSASKVSVEVGESIRFTDGSEDPEGRSLSFEWDFGDGFASSDRNPEHKFSVAGVYGVELTVSDDEGASDSKRLEVEVVEAKAPGGIPGFPVVSVVFGLLLALAVLRRGVWPVFRGLGVRMVPLE